MIAQFLRSVCLLLCLVFLVPAGGAKATTPFERPPYADEKGAVERLFHHKTQGARRVLAWIRHDHAVGLIAAYHRDGNIADLENGLKYARSATELAPDVVTFWRVLAMAALSFPQGDLTPLIAESALLRILEMVPGDRAGHRLLAGLYVGTGQYADAVPHFLQVLKTAPEVGPDFDLIKMAYACMEGAETGRCTLALEARIEARMGQIDAGKLSRTQSPAEENLALAILYRAQHLEAKAWKRLETVLMYGASSARTMRTAEALRRLWEETGPMVEAPDVEDWP